MAKYFRLFYLSLLIYSVQSSMQWYTCEQDDPYCTQSDFNISFSNLLKVFRILDISLTKNMNQFELYHHLDIIQGDITLDQSALCRDCESLFTKLKSASIQKLTSAVSNLGIFLCEHLKIQEPAVCESVLPLQISVILEKLQQKLLDPKKVCPRLLLCKKGIKKINVKKTIEHILSDKPDKVKPIPTAESTFKLLQINDPHVDLKYEPGQNIYCKEVVCCRNNNNPHEKQKKFEPAGQWGSLAECNIPIWTFENMIQYISKNLQVDLGIWTGDNIGHNLWEQTRYDGLNITLNLTTIIKNQLSAKFISMFGNHDSYPVNLYDFGSDQEDYLKNGLADAWESWIGKEAADQFRQHSYYSYYDYDYDVRVLVINTQSCYNLNFYNLDHPTDPNQQLSWLRDELYKAEKNGESVWIVGHIPPCNCFSIWAKIYNAIVDRFEYTIRAQFFAHLHKDFFTIQYDKKGRAVGIVYMPPTSGTYAINYHLNPSFRIFEVDLATKIPVNFYQYRLNLTYWNQFPKDTDVVWDLGYDMLSEYGMKNLWDFSEFTKLVERIKKDKTIREKFTRNFWSGNMNQVKTQENIMHCYTISDPLPQYLCLKSLAFTAYQVVLDALYGSWYVDKAEIGLSE